MVDADDLLAYEPGAYDRSLVQMRSRHYLAYVAQYPCAVCTFSGHSQKTRTTVDHVVSGGKARKGPDFWSIPLEKRKHVHGRYSVDQLGREGFRQHWGLPRYGLLALIYLTQYIEHEGWSAPVPRTDVDPEPTDRHSAIYYCEELQRILTQHNELQSWNWNP